jgi:hypothetical protein
LIVALSRTANVDEFLISMNSVAFFDPPDGAVHDH